MWNASFSRPHVRYYNGRGRNKKRESATRMRRTHGYGPRPGLSGSVDHTGPARTLLRIDQHKVVACMREPTECYTWRMKKDVARNQPRTPMADVRQTIGRLWGWPKNKNTGCQKVFNYFGTQAQRPPVYSFILSSHNCFFDSRRLFRRQVRSSGRCVHDTRDSTQAYAQVQYVPCRLSSNLGNVQHFHAKLSCESTP